MPYTSLNDAQVLCPALAPGKTQVWYMRPEWFRFGSLGSNPRVSIMPVTHILLGTIASTNPEEIFLSLQGETWSPLGRARDMLRKMGLEHTSMSVGDVLVIEDTVYLTMRTGFSTIGTWTPPEPPAVKCEHVDELLIEMNRWANHFSQWGYDQSDSKLAARCVRKAKALRESVAAIVDAD